MEYRVLKVSEQKEWKGIPYWEIEVEDKEGNKLNASIWRKSVIKGQIIDAEIEKSPNGANKIKLLEHGKSQLPPDKDDVERRIRQGFASEMIGLLAFIPSDKVLEYWKEFEQVYYQYVKNGKLP